jgi:phenylalanyl-tRNA synthetase beta chain
MKLSPQWLRDFVDLTVDPQRLADELTLAGIAVEAVSGTGDATVFEMEITTNRPDAMNHYGVARECSALYDLPLKAIVPRLASAAKTNPAAGGEGARNARAWPEGASSAASFSIQIEDPEGCPRYGARMIRGVTIQSSPEAIIQRLQSVDQRPINNAADASNYALWEMGHPTHAFDLDLLEGGRIKVRRAAAGETLRTIDGVDRKLSPEDLIIADAKKPVALAGVMGGFDTMITPKTSNILIESAWFDPVAVRQSSRRHALHTDASHRFERGADYGATSLAGARVAQLILESAGGQLWGDELDVIARAIDQAPVELRVSQVHRILGKRLATDEILRILRKLGFEMIPEPGEEDEFTVQIPSWRLDVEREIDLIEEIARLHGYDKFPSTQPSSASSVIELPDAEKDKKVRAAVLALGYNEAISSTFISHEEAEQFSSAPVLELANPLSEEASVMRTSMAPGMLHMLAYNLNRGGERVRLFETGNIFEASGDGALEHRRICLGATAASLKYDLPQGGKLDMSKGESAIALEAFRSFKGDLETLLAAFQHEFLEFKADAGDYFYPGRSARVVMDGASVAQFGQIHPEIAAARKLRQDIFVGELSLDVLYPRGLRPVRYQALPRYPAVERDFSFVFVDAVRFDAVQAAVESLGLSELTHFVPAEIFRGGAIPSGKYSLLLRATFQSQERTLRDDEVAQWSAAITAALGALGGAQRA